MPNLPVSQSSILPTIQPSCNSIGHGRNSFGVTPNRRHMKRRCPVPRPGGIGCLDQARQIEQYTVVIHAPADEVAPCLIAIGLKRYFAGLQPLTGRVELLAGDADGIGGIRIWVVRDAEEVGDLTQGQIPGPDAQRCLRVSWDIQR